MSKFLSKESIHEHCQCCKNLIGIAAYPKNGDVNPLLVSYSETVKGKGCEGESCNYVDIFGIMLVKLATKLNDISMCNLYITSVDSKTDQFIDPLVNNKAAVKLLLHTGVTVIKVITEEGEIKYNRQSLLDLLK